MKKVIFSQKQNEQIIKMYTKDKMTMANIGKQFGVSRTVISRILKENSIENNDRHKYTGNYRIFQNIDTAEKAYWLGFIAADGCVYERTEKGGNFISINIHRGDKKHLEKFLKFLNSNAQIIDHVQTKGFSNNTLMSKVTINSKDMVNDCKNKGIIPRKSLILEPPKISEEFWLPFILGYFDGDGSIYQSNSNNEFYLSIQGTKEMLEWINKILSISSKLEKRREDNKNSFYIRCGGYNKPYQILKKIYDSCSICLDRKHKIFQTLETVVLNRNIK